MNARLISRRAGCWARCCTGTDAIGELDYVDIVDDVAKSYVHRYRFDPTQEHKIFVGKDAVDDYGNGQRHRLCDAQRERTCPPHQRDRKERSVRERCCRVGSRGHRADRPAAAQPGAAQTVPVPGTAAGVLTRPRRTAARRATIPRSRHAAHQSFTWHSGARPGCCAGPPRTLGCTKQLIGVLNGRF